MHGGDRHEHAKFAIIYGADFQRFNRQARYGRMVQFMTLNSKDVVTFQPEICRKGMHTFELQTLNDFLTGNTDQDVPIGNPSAEFLPLSDDSCLQ
jgi:hypothetical protein